MLKNKYFRYLAFGALLVVIYYNLNFMLEQFRGSKPASGGGASGPSSNPPAAQPVQGPLSQESGGNPSIKQSPPAEYVEEMLGKDWGRDPFFTAQELEELKNPPPGPVEVVEAAPSEEPEVELQLQMVLLSSHGNVAVINDMTYRQGENVGPMRIQEIGPDGVVLQTAAGTRTLRLKRSRIRVTRTEGN